MCIIFQLAEHAHDLLQTNHEHEARTGTSLFGRGHSVFQGRPYVDDDEIRAMESPKNERRRLTFARTRLFADGMTEAKFKADIVAIVGLANIELVWLFNSGNGKLADRSCEPS